jgi:hypothetical protein
MYHYRILELVQSTFLNVRYEFSLRWIIAFCDVTPCSLTEHFPLDYAGSRARRHDV